MTYGILGRKRCKWIVMVNASFNAAAHDMKAPFLLHIFALFETHMQM